MEKLNQGELLEKLNKAFEYLPLSIANGQARRQIKERIQSHEKHQELTVNYIDIVIDLYEQLEQKGLQVTEEWIEDKVTSLFIVLNILKPSQNDVENIKTFIRTLYREAGCLVE